MSVCLFFLVCSSPRISASCRVLVSSMGWLRPSQKCADMAGCRVPVQALPQMDHRALAMLLWSLSRLQLQPSEPFLQAVMASTRQHMPSMSLLSIVTILSAFKSLRYLPPLPWMVEVCSAARAKVSTDSTAKVWQQRACVRRFEETVAWYNQTVQQQTGVSLSSVDGSMDGEEVEEVEWQEEVARSRRLRLGMAAKTSSEAMLAAAMGVAAAVAQQWHP